MSSTLPVINDGMGTHSDDVKIISRERVFNGYRKLDKFSFTHTSMNPKAEKWLPEMTREIMCSSNVAAVLLYEPKKNVLLMNRQFRLAGMLAGYESPFMLECVAGMVDGGETPEEAAYRETFEETGSKVKDMEFVGKVLPSAGASTENIYLYCACIDSIPLEKYHGLPEEGEEIETEVMTIEQVEKLIDEDKVHNAMALILLNWFLRHHLRLKEKWS